jgi:hypothetical protein
MELSHLKKIKTRIMKQGIIKAWKYTKKNIKELVFPIVVVLLIADCESRRKSDQIAIENIKANEYNKGFAEGINAAVNGLLSGPYTDAKTKK